MLCSNNVYKLIIFYVSYLNIFNFLSNQITSGSLLGRQLIHVLLKTNFCFCTEMFYSKVIYSFLTYYLNSLLLLIKI